MYDLAGRLRTQVNKRIHTVGNSAGLSDERIVGLMIVRLVRCSLIFRKVF